jgi:hypothetical protein
MIDSCQRHHTLPANSFVRFDSLKFDTEFPSLEPREYVNPCVPKPSLKNPKKRKSDSISESPGKKAKTSSTRYGSDPLESGSDHRGRVMSGSDHHGRVMSGSDSEDEEEYDTTNLRISLKIVRDPTKNAYDLLPSGETIGAFANKHALARYARKIENKRERAREIRKKKKKIVKRDKN